MGTDWPAALWAVIGWLVDSLSDLRGSSVNVSIGRRTKVEIHPLAQGSGTPKRAKKMKYLKNYFGESHTIFIIFN